MRRAASKTVARRAALGKAFVPAPLSRRAFVRRSDMPYKKTWRAVIAAALVVPTAALAQAYPSKPIRLVTEFIGGSGGDALLRLAMGPVSQSMGQPILVDSHPGAGGLVAAELVARAEPDGYTWLAGAPNVHTTRPWITRT